mmetsp:Transcript_54108/g.150483  ORF Transcript_54108/g.150483 Transcript_54108/m.150483 type:complete len:393 (-) Transcript_54108:286-1464(-)
MGPPPASTPQPQKPQRIRAFVFLALALLLGRYVHTGFVTFSTTRLQSLRHQPQTSSQAVSTFGAEVVTPKNVLQWLQGVSITVPDQFSFDGFDTFPPKLAFVSARTVHEALSSGNWPDLDKLVDEALRNEECSVDWELTEEGQSCFEESLFALVSKRLLGTLPYMARVSVEIPFTSLSTGVGAVRSGHRLMKMLKEVGVDSSRVLLRLPATYEGLRAAEQLGAEGVHVHLTHVYSLEQAALAKEAGVSAVQVNVGRIDKAGGDGTALARDIYSLLQPGDAANSQEKRTALIAASLRSEADVLALSGADYLLVPPSLLKQMQEEPADAVSISPLAKGPLPEFNKLRTFLLSREGFDEALPATAQQLLARGVAKYEAECKQMDKIIADALAYLK